MHAFDTSSVTALSQEYPEVQIASAHVKANLYLPDSEHGFYRGTRFDWSGVISRLQCHGHEYYGAWYTRRDPSVRDFIFAGSDIIAGLQSAITGPAEEFVAPQGYAEAKRGETFIKIGVGALRKAGDAEYSCYNNYEMVDSGTWSSQQSESSVEFTQELADRTSGYGYTYKKTISLISDRPEMVIEHSLTNTGRVPIRTMQYNHNFLTLDGTLTGPDFVITFPFQIQTTQTTEAVNPHFVKIDGNQIVYRRPLGNDDVVGFPVNGFGKTSRDYDIQIENRRAGAGLRITADRSLVNLAVWSIRSVLSVEPFIDVNIEPSDTATWSYAYAPYVV